MGIRLSGQKECIGSFDFRQVVLTTDYIPTVVHPVVFSFFPFDVCGNSVVNAGECSRVAHMRAFGCRMGLVQGCSLAA